MEKKEVEIGSPITTGQVTLIPVVELSLNYWCSGGRFSCFGTKQPASIVVVSPSGKRAFSISGEEVPLGQFLKESPAMREVLQTI
ncbi:hypothetical protein ACFLTV_00880 [Chloroflexota bacterium]